MFVNGCRLVTTQSFRDAEIIEGKQEAEDYVVLVTPMFMLGTECARAVLDGHHSLEAAVRDGVTPLLVEICAGQSGQVKPLLDATTGAAYAPDDTSMRGGTDKAASCLAQKSANRLYR
jgi:hypothetical protein